MNSIVAITTPFLSDQIAWTTAGLLGAGLAVTLIVATTWRAISVRGNAGHRWYWICVACLMWVGLIGAGYVLALPPERLDEAGFVIGEMPDEFGFACMVVMASMCGAVAGFALSALARIQRTRKRVP